MSVTTSSSSGPFALRTVLIIIAIGGVAIAGLVYLSLYGRDYSEPLTVQANTFSRSSIGHKAFFQTLRELGIAVQLSRFATIDKTGPSDLLVVAEPSSDSANSDLLESLESMPQALLVLPKWKATPRGSWAASLYPVDREQVLSWILDLGGLAPDRDQLIENPAHDRVENFALAGKMMEQRRLADAGAARDHLEGGAVVPVVGELLLGNGKNLVVGIGDRMRCAPGPRAAHDFYFVLA